MVIVENLENMAKEKDKPHKTPPPRHLCLFPAFPPEKSDHPTDGLPFYNCLVIASEVSLRHMVLHFTQEGHVGRLLLLVWKLPVPKIICTLPSPLPTLSCVFNLLPVPLTSQGRCKLLTGRSALWPCQGASLSHPFLDQGQVIN